MSERCREVLLTSVSPAGVSTTRECGEPAEFILWGKLFEPEALGPRCRFHAVRHTDPSMPSQVSQYAIYDLRSPIARRRGSW